MSLPPQKMREAVFQLLYSLDNSESNVTDIISLISKELEISKKYAVQALEKVIKIRGTLETIDKEITSVSQSYTFDRITSVEKNILRLGAYEILFDEDIPHKVAIAEGMRLTKKFSTPEAAAFVNAVLDAIYKRKEGLQIDDAMLQNSVKQLEQSQAIAEEASQNQKMAEEEQ